MKRDALVVAVGVCLLLSETASAQPAGQAATKVLASVEGRWEQMFCDLTEVSRPTPNELMVRFR